MTRQALRVLLVEDNEDDAILLVSRLRRAGYEVMSERVDTPQSLDAALTRGGWDLILSDYKIPGFSGIAALELVQSRKIDVPFFIISGTIDDETASAVMRAGAQDYLSKDRLDRLIPAVERELREARMRTERLAAIEAARDHEARLAALAANIPGAAFQLRRATSGAIEIDYLSEGALLLFEVPLDELLGEGERLLGMILPDDRTRFDNKLTDCSERSATLNWEGRIRVPGRDTKWINVRATPTALADGTTRWEGVMWNITLSKQAQAELSESRAQLAELSNHLQSVKEDERERIARDIHDVLGGLLVGIKIELSLLATRLEADPAHGARAKRIADLVDDAITTAGRVARELRPGILKEFGLAAAIESHAEDFAQRTGLKCNVLCADHDIECAEEAEIAIFRIFQESLTNIAKHARAKEVTVRLMQEGDEVVLQVTDDGVGIRSADLAKPRSFGLRGMRERVASLGGSVDITAVPPHGTQILLRAPIAQPTHLPPSLESTRG
ncbi:PAS domain-containing protein [Niveibacterium umoris]|uniref:Signal transduction histidine kinase n=1 Tax=Niveibacterium umoris TaxID=1193620 RepID=A0A840BGU1_9RHOO|nr:response regulator [Niveibacterium umoris]MBB4011883.1 signal transduction histidine kinase [Niveibacterium umoris]